ncbi:MAG: type II toxin-antitoxin system VapC family toxin [Syntrophales bacterium]|nr:type II toxin-antitoxin system VapC family toxin [Syntrophales bacterium]MDP3097047.1 type II toxin-antitoxin system VapC family toxin [Syntrophales bacterium]
MADQVLLDTDVLIDYLRDYDAAVVYLEGLSQPLLVSVITVAELYSGVQEGKERNVLDQFMRAFDKIPIDDNIAMKAGLIRRQYGPSHGIGLADALVAATAAVNNAKVATLNKSHFPMIKTVVPYQKS